MLGNAPFRRTTRSVRLSEMGQVFSRMAQGQDIAAGAPGEPLETDVSVCALDGTPIADAEVDMWQAGEEGLYDVRIAALGP